MTMPDRILIVAGTQRDALTAAASPRPWPDAAVTAATFATKLGGETFDGVLLLEWPPPGWLDALLPQLRPGAIVRMPSDRPVATQEGEPRTLVVAAKLDDARNFCRTLGVPALAGTIRGVALAGRYFHTIYVLNEATEAELNRLEVRLVVPGGRMLIRKGPTDD